MSKKKSINKNTIDENLSRQALSKQIVKNIFKDLKKQAKKTDIDFIIDNRDQSRFYSTSSKKPLCSDKHIHNLWSKYGFPHSMDPNEQPYLFFETLPITTKDNYDYHLSGEPKSERKQIKKFQQKHQFLEDNITLDDNEIIDYIRLYSWSNKSRNLSFAIREIWSLSNVIPYLLYPRIQEYIEWSGFNKSTSKDTKRYYKKVLKPIIKALIYEMYLDNIIVTDWIKENRPDDYWSLSNTIIRDTQTYIEKKIKKGYKLLAKYHRGFWI